jgi:hypothetical protein
MKREEGRKPSTEEQWTKKLSREKLTDMLQVYDINLSSGKFYDFSPENLKPREETDDASLYFSECFKLHKLPIQ